jgi:hypothetical protein
MIGTLKAIDAHASDRTGLIAGILDGYAGYSENVRKACRILDGDVSALKGPKVTAFANAILGDMSSVTVDVWATRAARSNLDNLLHLYTDREVPGARERRAIAAAYENAAAARGVEPAAMQAAVWVQVRESDRFVRPQLMSAAERLAFWKKQARARAASGLGVPYDWNGTGTVKADQYGATS